MPNAFVLMLLAQAVVTRLPENPLITPKLSPTLGNNINGPSLIRVPAWVQKPLGRYYLYFAHHNGRHIRLAYADAVRGPWKIHEPGVLQAKDTAFAGDRTHIASPDVHVDDQGKRIVMYFHGAWQDRSDGGPTQRTQAAVSSDGLTFTVQPPITNETYLRVFRRGSHYYALGRLGTVWRASDPLSAFEKGGEAFAGTLYAGRVRHVALMIRGDNLHVYFSAIGDAPEQIMLSTIDLTRPWTQWRAGVAKKVLLPEKDYECAGLPVAKSKEGLAREPVRELRDPAVFEEENGKVYLLYATCGEQGSAAAEIR
jgi:hypothetical protein